MFRTIFNLVAIITMLILTTSYLQNRFSSDQDFSSLVDREIVTIEVNGKSLNVEVVNTAETTSQGLSSREKIGSDGMLFVFPEKNTRSFWMKDMKFDLDIIWIDGDKIVGISKDVKKPSPNAKNNELELISIDQQTDKVLELNAGDVEKYHFQVGNVVILK